MKSDSSSQDWEVMIRELRALDVLVEGVIKTRCQGIDCPVKDAIVKDLKEVRYRISSIKTRFGSEAGEYLEHEEDATKELAENRKHLYVFVMNLLLRLGCDPDVQETVRYALELVMTYLNDLMRHFGDLNNN